MRILALSGVWFHATDMFHIAVAAIGRLCEKCKQGESGPLAVSAS